MKSLTSIAAFLMICVSLMSCGPSATEQKYAHVSQLEDGSVVYRSDEWGGDTAIFVFSSDEQAQEFALKIASADEPMQIADEIVKPEWVAEIELITSFNRPAVRIRWNGDLERTD